MLIIYCRNHKRLISSGGQSDIDFEYQDSDNDQKSNFKGVDSAVESTSKYLLILSYSYYFI